MKPLPYGNPLRFRTKEDALAHMAQSNPFYSPLAVQPILMEMKHGHNIYRWNPEYEEAQFEMQLWQHDDGGTIDVRAIERHNAGLLGMIRLERPDLKPPNPVVRATSFYCGSCKRIIFDPTLPCSVCGILKR